MLLVHKDELIAAMKIWEGKATAEKIAKRIYNHFILKNDKIYQLVRMPYRTNGNSPCPAERAERRNCISQGYAITNGEEHGQKRAWERRKENDGFVSLNDDLINRRIQKCQQMKRKCMNRFARLPV